MKSFIVSALAAIAAADSKRHSTFEEAEGLSECLTTADPWWCDNPCRIAWQLGDY